MIMPDLRKALERFGKQNGEVFQAFQNLHSQVIADGVLDTKTKKLMMVAVAVAIRCEPCLRLHVRDALEMGMTREEIIEACNVAILMGGGPMKVYTFESYSNRGDRFRNYQQNQHKEKLR